MYIILRILMLTLTGITCAHAAIPVDLRQESPTILQSYLQPKKTLSTPTIALKLIKSEIDINHVMHTRFKQTYANFPVWGGDVIIHSPNAHMKWLIALAADKQSSMNGLIYRDLEKDLSAPSVLNDTNKKKSLEAAKKEFRPDKQKQYLLTNESAEPLVYVSSDNKAHFAYKVSFYVWDNKTGPHRPNIIIDAETLQIYKSWDDIKTQSQQQVESIGGNAVIGKLFYDDYPEHLPKLNMYVDGDECSFENNSVVFKRGLRGDGVASIYNYNVNQLPFIKAPCHFVNGSLKIDFHEKDSFEGADSLVGDYSPASNAFYGLQMTYQLYQQWYGIPVYSDETGKAKKITAILHFDTDLENNHAWNNAAFDRDSNSILIGDGSLYNYPYTTLEILSHELGHAFTDQHSNLVYASESGGINESFSDMSAKAVEFMVTGKNNWNFGFGIQKDGQPMRYMDDPKKDHASIDNVKDFEPTMDVHDSSGIFNKAFYLLATTQGWDTRKAFDVMVEANRYYWTSNICFEQAADGVITAGKQLGYNVNDIRNAFEKVGITSNLCSKHHY